MNLEPDLTDDIGYYKLFHGTQLYFLGNRANGEYHIYMDATVP